MNSLCGLSGQYDTGIASGFYGATGNKYISMKRETSMEEFRRSGADRRKHAVTVDQERRNGEDRRAAHRDSGQIVDCMKKIPIFNGLTDEQYQKVLNICSKKLIPVNQYLIRVGDSSHELFILMKGRLEVQSKSRSLIAHITTLGLVGEMGVFIDTPRTASVVATEDCVVLRISKRELFDLFNGNCALGNRILLNVVKDLAIKLHEENAVIEEMRKRRSQIL